MAREIDDVPTFDRKRWHDGLQQWVWSENGEFQPIRFFGLVYSDARHAIKTKTGKTYYEYCLGYDVDKDEFYADRNERCPCCALGIKDQLRYFMNGIDMTAWKNRPADMDPSWTPVRMIDLTPTFLKSIAGLKQMNEGISVFDPKGGAILGIKFNKKGTATDMYGCTLHTRNWAIPPEIAAFGVIQQMPDGRKVEIKGKNGCPGAFVYNRVVSTRREMEDSLRRHGYYDTAPSAAPAPADQPETSTEAVDEIPFDVAPVSPPASAKTGAADVGNVPANCPAAFGQFAEDRVCFTSCKVRAACKQAKIANMATQQQAVSDDDTL